MLDIGHERSVVDELWLEAEARVKLPMITAKYFFEPKGAMPNHFSNRRSFHRFYLRSKALLMQDKRILGAYTTDVSRQGIGFLSPVQLMPKDKWRLRLPTGTEYQLQITRCRRESDHCFACGGRFVSAITNT